MKLSQAWLSMVAAVSALAEARAPGELQGKLEALAQRARPGVLGVAVLDVRIGAAWHVNATREYPMMSVFKAPLGATVLARIDHGDISFDQTMTLTRVDLRGGRSEIVANFQGDRMTLTVRELLVDAVSHSDNTAADALVRLVGGPQTVTTFLRAHGIEGMHVDWTREGWRAYSTTWGLCSPHRLCRLHRPCSPHRPRPNLLQTRPPRKKLNGCRVAIRPFWPTPVTAARRMLRSASCASFRAMSFCRLARRNT